MYKQNINDLKQWFVTYVKQFNSNDKNVQENIVLKKNHTIRVCNNIIELGKSLSLNEYNMQLTEIIALLHDIGRFKQYYKYKTFEDSLSEDHAELGISIINSKGLLNFLSDKDQCVVIECIRYHNKIKIPQNKDKQFELFAKMIRDADKLDIYQVLLNMFKDNNSDSLYSKEIVKLLLENKNINYTLIKNQNDRKLLCLGWIYDINYKYTLNKIKEGNIIEKIIEYLPKDKDIQKVYRNIKQYIDMSLSN